MNKDCSKGFDAEFSLSFNGIYYYTSLKVWTVYCKLIKLIKTSLSRKKIGLEKCSNENSIIFRNFVTFEIGQFLSIHSFPPCLLFSLNFQLVESNVICTNHKGERLVKFSKFNCASFVLRLCGNNRMVLKQSFYSNFAECTVMVHFCKLLFFWTSLSFRFAAGSVKKKAPKAPNRFGSKSSLLDGCGDNNEDAEIAQTAESELSHSSDSLTNGDSASHVYSSLIPAEQPVAALTADRHSKLVEANKPKPSPRTYRVPRPTVAPPPPPLSGASSPMTESKNTELQRNVEQSPASLSPKTENNYVPSLENTNATHLWCLIFCFHKHLFQINLFY